jgi:prepilin-type processing-associated H-X9-DG protein
MAGGGGYGLHCGWLGHLLPFVDQGPLDSVTRQAFAVQPDFTKIPPHSGLGTVISLFGCPSDVRVGVAHTAKTGLEVALSSYLGVCGSSYLAKNGVLYANSRIALETVSDGSSNTLLVGERPPSVDLAWGWWYAGVGQDGAGSGDLFLGTRELVRHWSPRSLCNKGPYAFVRPESADSICGKYQFWSLHDGGAHFGFCDGSVRFLPYSADVVMGQLGTRNGGEVVGNF